MSICTSLVMATWCSKLPAKKLLKHRIKFPHTELCHSAVKQAAAVRNWLTVQYILYCASDEILTLDFTSLIPILSFPVLYF